MPVLESTEYDAIDADLVHYCGWRVVRNAKRRRQLIRRGETIYWSHWFQGWVWNAKDSKICNKK